MSDNIIEAINDFLVAGQQTGWSTNTVRQYHYHLGRFGQWMADRGITTVSDLDRRRVREWGASLHTQWSPSTVKLAVTSVRSFFRWAREEELLANDLELALKLPSVPERVQRTLTKDEVRRLLDACETPVARGLTPEDALASAVRNAAIVALLYDAMIRASELCRLELADIDLKSGRLVVRSGKGGRDRMALFGPQAAETVGAWLAVRRADPGITTVFVSIGGNTPNNPLTARGLRIIVKNLGERAGIADVSPHTFRRGGAAQLTLSGVSTRVVQLLGGWSKISMVEIYTRALSLQSDEVQGIFNQHSPISAARTGNGKP